MAETTEIWTFYTEQQNCISYWCLKSQVREASRLIKFSIIITIPSYQISHHSVSTCLYDWENKVLPCPEIWELTDRILIFSECLQQLFNTAFYTHRYGCTRLWEVECQWPLFAHFPSVHITDHLLKYNQELVWKTKIAKWNHQNKPISKSVSIRQ